MAKRISSGESKPRRAPARRRTDKPEVPSAEATPEARGAESPGSLAGEAGTSGLMTGTRGGVAVARSTTDRELADSVAHAASSKEVWGAEEHERDAVARRAFELFLERGRVHGHDVEDWLQAERELSARGLQSSKTRA